MMKESRKNRFSPRWILASLGVLLLAAVFVRLGFWQLDRLSQRRAQNALLERRMSAPAVSLNPANLSGQPSALEFRTAVATGSYDFAHQVALGSRVYNGQLGIDLLTPLVIQGGRQAVLVDRGWIPYSDLSRSTWSQFDLSGAVTVRGMVLQGQAAGGAGIPATGGQARPQDLWSSVAVQKIQAQVPEQLLPYYIQEIPGSAQSSPPFAQAPQIDLSDGPHLGYAVEWFSFAAIALIGYPLWLRRQRIWERAGKADQAAASGENAPQDEEAGSS